MLQLSGLVAVLFSAVACTHNPVGSIQSSDNRNNFGDWDDSGNTHQANKSSVKAGSRSNVTVSQNNQAVGGAAQQVGNGNNASSGGTGVVGRSSGSSDNRNNFGEWDESGNTWQINDSDVWTGDRSKVQVKQNNEAVGGSSQQTGNGNNLSSGSNNSKKKPAPRKRW